MSDKKRIEKLEELVRRYQTLIKWINKYTKDIIESQRGRNFLFAIDKLESELQAIDSEEAIITEKKEKIVEYKFEIIKRDEPLIPFLNEQSKEGWEVVQFETRIQSTERKTGTTALPQTEAVNQILFKRLKSIQRVEREVTDKSISIDQYLNLNPELEQ